MNICFFYKNGYIMVIILVDFLAPGALTKKELCGIIYYYSTFHRVDRSGFFARRKKQPANGGLIVPEKWKRIAPLAAFAGRIFGFFLLHLAIAGKEKCKKLKCS